MVRRAFLFRYDAACLRTERLNLAFLYSLSTWVCQLKSEVIVRPTILNDLLSGIILPQKTREGVLSFRLSGECDKLCFCVVICNEPFLRPGLDLGKVLVQGRSNTGTASRGRDSG